MCVSYKEALRGWAKEVSRAIVLRPWRDAGRVNIRGFCPGAPVSPLHRVVSQPCLMWNLVSGSEGKNLIFSGSLPHACLTSPFLPFFLAPCLKPTWSSSLPPHHLLQQVAWLNTQQGLQSLAATAAALLRDYFRTTCLLQSGLRSAREHGHGLWPTVLGNWRQMSSLFVDALLVSHHLGLIGSLYLSNPL